MIQLFSQPKRALRQLSYILLAAVIFPTQSRAQCSLPTETDIVGFRLVEGVPRQLGFPTKDGPIARISDNKLVERGQIVGGLMHGIWYECDGSRVLSSVEYLKGKRHGVERKGNIELRWVDGRLHGLSKWQKDDTQYWQMAANGRAHGVWVEKGAAITRRGFALDGSEAGVLQSIDATGIQRQDEMLSGILHGHFRKRDGVDPTPFFYAGMGFMKPEGVGIGLYGGREVSESEWQKLPIPALDLNGLLSAPMENTIRALEDTFRDSAPSPDQADELPLRNSKATSADTLQEIFVPSKLERSFPGAKPLQVNLIIPKLDEDREKLRKAVLSDSLDAWPALEACPAYKRLADVWLSFSNTLELNTSIDVVKRAKQEFDSGNSLSLSSRALFNRWRHRTAEAYEGGEQASLARFMKEIGSLDKDLAIATRNIHCRSWYLLHGNLQLSSFQLREDISTSLLKAWETFIAGVVETDSGFTKDEIAFFGAVPTDGARRYLSELRAMLANNPDTSLLPALPWTRGNTPGLIGEDRLTSTLFDIFWFLGRDGLNANCGGSLLRAKSMPKQSRYLCEGGLNLVERPAEVACTSPSWPQGSLAAEIILQEVEQAVRIWLSQVWRESAMLAGNDRAKMLQELRNIRRESQARFDKARATGAFIAHPTRLPAKYLMPDREDYRRLSFETNSIDMNQPEPPEPQNGRIPACVERSYRSWFVQANRAEQTAMDMLDSHRRAHDALWFRWLELLDARIEFMQKSVKIEADLVDIDSTASKDWIKTVLPVSPFRLTSEFSTKNRWKKGEVILRTRQADVHVLDVEISANDPLIATSQPGAEMQVFLLDTNERPSDNFLSGQSLRKLGRKVFSGVVTSVNLRATTAEVQLLLFDPHMASASDVPTAWWQQGEATSDEQVSISYGRKRVRMLPSGTSNLELLQRNLKQALDALR